MRLRRLHQVALALLSVSALGGAPPAAAAVTGACHVSPVVADVERSVRFYRDLLGLEPSATGPIPWRRDTAQAALHGLRDVRLRSAELRIPGTPCGVEPIEFEAADRRSARLRLQDPGAVMIILLVRDIDAAFAKLTAAKVPVVTTGGAPVIPSATSTSRAVIVTDPDGHFIELAQLATQPQTSVPAASNVFAIRLRLTVADLARSSAFYRDQLGLPVKPVTFQRGAGVMAMMGLPETVEYAVTLTTVPGSTLVHELLQLRGIEGTPSRARVQDPGGYRLELTVDDLDGTLAATSKAGARVISRDVISTAAGRAAIVSDPDGVYLVLRQGTR